MVWGSRRLSASANFGGVPPKRLAMAAAALLALADSTPDEVPNAVIVERGEKLFVVGVRHGNLSP
jgi:hypothetical protein